MGIESWSTTPGSNTSAPPDGAPEGMAPSAVNDTMRQQMADHRTQWNDAQWFQYGDGDGAGTVTYVAANQFKVEGADVTAHYHVGRRVKVTGTATGTVYGTITTVSFSTDTTVTVQLDSGTLNNEALTVWTGTQPVENSALGGSSADVDGGDHAFVIGNSAAGGSTDETVTLKFEHNGAFSGSLQSYRVGDYASGANEDSGMQLRVSKDGSASGRIVYKANEFGATLIGSGVNGQPDINANNDGGLTVDQGDNDDEAISLKSSDVGHALTSVAETNTYGLWKKTSGTEGGLLQIALGESGQASPHRFETYGGDWDFGKTSSTSGAAFVFYATEHDGVGSTRATTANSNVFMVRANNADPSVRTLFIVDEDGDLHVDGSASLSTFDAHDDAMLARAFDLTRAETSSDVVRSEFDQFVHANREALTEVGILGELDPEIEAAGDRPLVNVTQLQRLHNGAIWQEYQRMLVLVDELEKRLPGLMDSIQERLAANGLPPLPLEAPERKGILSRLVKN